MSPIHEMIFASEHTKGYPTLKISEHFFDIHIRLYQLYASQLIAYPKLCNPCVILSVSILLYLHYLPSNNEQANARSSYRHFACIILYTLDVIFCVCSLLVTTGGFLFCCIPYYRLFSTYTPSCCIYVPVVARQLFSGLFENDRSRPMHYFYKFCDVFGVTVQDEEP